MNMKVLSPAGDMESLKQAVFNGADEVYLGVKDFNARNIEGFSIQTLKQAVDFAHIYGVKVHLAVNILFDDYELQSTFDLVREAYNLGVDAFIIQDVGLAQAINQNYPQIEMHCSTQMGIHNLEGAKVVESLGFKRVVLARETPLEEIKRIKQNTNLEIEYFVQGALCVCFSGNCYLSSYLFDASGNRGKCKQLCRLPYSLQLGNKTLASGYLLSAKDFNMLNRLKDLQEAGVDAIKIEGRARRAFYVAEATKTYAKAIKGEQYLNHLNLAFNRGYTEGYFNGNGDIISNIQSHIGVEIGKVEKVKLGKKFNEVYINSTTFISPKSILKFFKNNKEVAVLTAFDVKKDGNLTKITTTQKIESGTTVNLISDYNLENETLNFKLKRNLKIKITAKVGKPIKITATVNNKKVTVEGSVCEQAKTSALTEKDYQTCFNKNEYFNAELTLDVENVFMSKQQLNEVRRLFFEKVVEELTKVNHLTLPRKFLKITQKTQKMNNFQVIFDKNVELSAENIIYSPSEYVVEDIKQFEKKCKNQNKNMFLNLPNFALKQDIEFLTNLLNQTNVGVVVNNMWALNFTNKKIIGGYMNVFNSLTANYFDAPYVNAEGENKLKMPYMTLRHCPMKNHLKVNCSNCPYKDGYIYKMENGTTLKLKRIKMSTCTFYLC